MYIISFTSKVKRIVKKMNTREVKEFNTFLDIAEIDPFNKILKTHKLSGDLKNCYAARLNYSDRVVFFIEEENSLIVIDTGSHDEVY